MSCLLSVWLIALAVFVPCQAAELPPPVKPQNILVLMPISSKSHRIIMSPLVNALADRGHKITMLINHPPSSKHPNIVEIHHGLSHYPEKTFDAFETHLKIHTEGLPAVARDLYNVPEVRELYNRKHEFHFAIIDKSFNEVAYPFLEGIPFIGLLIIENDYTISAVMGNVFNPAVIPNLVTAASIPKTFMDRLTNLFADVVLSILWRKVLIVPSVQKEIDVHFPSLPPLLEIERNISLLLENSHFSMEPPKPQLPNQVQIACIQCKHAKKLPKDIEEWISSAGKTGVIYFSLGSVVQANSMPEQLLKTFLEAFAKMPEERIIWKFEKDLPNKPRNVLIRKWLPQQDILGDPRVKLFITHGGQLSAQESIYHGKPVLTMPIFGDQAGNSKKMERLGVGESIQWDTLTPEILIEKVQKMTENPTYQKEAHRRSVILRDQFQSPVDTAVWWAEYVMRHGGATHLRTHAVDLTWTEYLMLDVFLFLLIVLHLFMFLVYKAVLYCVRISQKTKQKHKGKKD